MHCKVVIPARLGSTRLPGKPLLEIAGKPMIQHVCDRAVEAGVGEVVVATDEQEVVAAVEAFGGAAVLTSASHESGTDRLAEVAELAGWGDDTIVVNLQGDEPLMDPVLIGDVAGNLDQDPVAGISTLATPILARSDIFSPDVVKVVVDKASHALYFSRAPIPWVRGDYGGDDTEEMPSAIQPLRHLGIYAYRVGVLRQIATLPPVPIEQVECLEQLRALWHGIRIHVGVIDDAPGHGVDTQEDLERVRRIFESQ